MGFLLRSTSASSSVLVFMLLECNNSKSLKCTYGLWWVEAAESHPGYISSPPEMIAAIRAAILKPQGYYSHLETAFFHSTPILQRKHQSNSKARIRKRAKQELRRNVNAFAQHLFGIWSDGFDYSGCFDFSDVDEGSEIDYFLRTALGGGSRGYSCSFTHEERKPRGRARGFSWSNTHQKGGARSGRYSNNFRKSWDSRYRLDEEEEDHYSSTEWSDTEPNQESHRQALGLSSSGPLNLEDVKIAYRACALKWHPDRHHASTKNAAEEKFKLCTVAYQSLCEKLATN